MEAVESSGISINDVIMWIMMGFMVIAAFDRILTQFGGAEKVLGKIGLKKLGEQFSGSGEQFEEGFMAMGALGLAMVGVIAMAPVLAKILLPVVEPIYVALGANPAMFATSLIANDMGGYALAMSLAGSDTASGVYAGLILGAMMGPTIVFIIPVALGIIDAADRRYLALGVLAGMVTIPIGCIAGGLVAMGSDIVVNGQPVNFTFATIFYNLTPVVLISVLLALGLKFIPEKMIAGFQIFAKCLVAFITFGLACSVIEAVIGVQIIPGMDPIFGSGMAIETIGYIACVLLGAYPMVFLLTRWFGKPLMKVGKVLKMNDTAAAGMIATLANAIPMFALMKNMDNRGKVINVAFAVSAAFTFGDHLGFTAANASSMIFPMIVGKLIGGVTAIFVAMLIAPKPTVGLEENKVGA